MVKILITGKNYARIIDAMIDDDGKLDYKLPLIDKPGMYKVRILWGDLPEYDVSKFDVFYDFKMECQFYEIDERYDRSTNTEYINRICNLEMPMCDEKMCPFWSMKNA